MEMLTYNEIAEYLMQASARLGDLAREFKEIPAEDDTFEKDAVLEMHEAMQIIAVPIMELTSKHRREHG